MRVDAGQVLGGVITVGVLGFLGYALMPVFACACKSASPKTASVSNIKQLATSAAIYSTDYDDLLPMARTWGTELGPYTKNEVIFNDFMIRPKKFGFAFFEPVGGSSMESVENASEVPMLFQSLILDLNAHSDLRSLPIVPRDKGERDLYANVDTSAKLRPRAWALKKVVIEREKGL